MIQLPITKHYSCDVLVVGGGVAGISAACCAARGGVSFILAERDGCLGGSARTQRGTRHAALYRNGTGCRYGGCHSSAKRAGDPVPAAHPFKEPS
ncbi:MAG: FAD-dependent oxidoreductase [Lachnospiraceae bacterium]|nr:FAD-dependent oxidoreductase [Lachnospiraceae bacterium]